MSNYGGVPGAAGRYRKRPGEIDAMQWTGWNYTQSEQFMGEPLAKGTYQAPPMGAAQKMITTLHGMVVAEPGDWIIRGLGGDYWPCKPDIFEATYEPVAASGGLDSADA